MSKRLPPFPEGVKISYKRATCDCCKKQRPLARRDSYYHYCSECYLLTPEEKKAVRDSAKRKTYKLAYPIIGGPLDGEHAITDDMSSYGDALYKEVAHEYVEFNGVGGGRKRVGGFPPTMIYVHKSLLKPLVSARER